MDINTNYQQNHSIDYNTVNQSYGTKSKTDTPKYVSDIEPVDKVELSEQGQFVLNMVNKVQDMDPVREDVLEQVNVKIKQHEMELYPPPYLEQKLVMDLYNKYKLDKLHTTE